MFTAEGLEILARNNDAQISNSITHHVKMLRSLIDRVAENAAKANAEWHDDPAAEDHAEWHAPAIEQYPREVRDECIRSLVDFYLGEFTIQEGQQ
jgi:hypothetical protein